MAKQSSSINKPEYSVEIHVVGHHQREEKAQTLSDTLYADYTWIDNGSLGEWNNHYRAWAQGSYSEATHVCVLQDDAVPIAQFTGALMHSIERRPDEMLGLYVGNGRPNPEEVSEAVKQAEILGAGWISTDALCWGVGTVLPTYLIPDMLNSLEGHKSPYDQRLSAWLHYSYRNAFYPWPSLVDHEDTPSLVWKGDQGVRKAHKTGVPNDSSTVVWLDRYPNWMSPSKFDKARHVL